MSIIVTKTPNTYAFAGNPVVFELTADNQDEVVLEITARGETITASYFPFGTGGSYKVKTDLSGFLTFEPEPLDIPEGYPVMPLPGEFMVQYTVATNGEQVFSGYIFRGGISKLAYKTLAENGYDMFTYRLRNQFTQFLFTTRTNAKVITIRRTELYPFAFIHPGRVIEFRSVLGNVVTTDALPEGTPAIMDIGAVKEEFKLRYNEDPATIEVWISGNISFTFNIIPGQLSEENYLIRFRNSLGAYEQIEVTGIASHNVELEEEDTFNSFNDFDFFEEHRSRTVSRSAIEVETGYKSRSELPFILDMIKSDEIYFIYPDGTTVRCHVTADDIKYEHRMTEPRSIALTIREVVDEEFHTPAIIFSEDDGIFDDTFNDYFE